MSLKDIVIQDQIQAMKNRETAKLSILRMLSAAIKNEEIAQGGELSEEIVQIIISRQIKQLTEASKDFVRGGRQDLAAQAKGEIDILQTYLPEQMNDEELKAVVKKVLIDNDLTEAGQMGRAMGLVMKEIKGKADGNKVKQLVNELLTV